MVKASEGKAGRTTAPGQPAGPVSLASQSMGQAVGVLLKVPLPPSSKSAKKKVSAAP